jgi:hypothetical protein
MVAEKDQPGVSMQMVWKQQTKKTRPLVPVKTLPFQLANEEDEDAPSASGNVEERPLTGVEGAQPSTGTSGQTQSSGPSEFREDLEHVRQSERLLDEGNDLAKVNFVYSKF